MSVGPFRLHLARTDSTSGSDELIKGYWRPSLQLVSGKLFKLEAVSSNGFWAFIAEREAVVKRAALEGARLATWAAGEKRKRAKEPEEVRARRKRQCVSWCAT